MKGSNPVAELCFIIVAYGEIIFLGPSVDFQQHYHKWLSYYEESSQFTTNISKIGIPGSSHPAV